MACVLLFARVFDRSRFVFATPQVTSSLPGTLIPTGVRRVHKFLSVGLVVVLSVAGRPSAALAEAQSASQAATLIGSARRTDLGPLANATVQIRSLSTAEVVASTVSDGSGEFSFSSLQPGDYLIELVDASGRIVGTTTPFSLAAGASVSVSVVASAAGAAAATAGGFSLLGLGPVASIAALGAAGAAAITAVITIRPDASPSR
jgi:hypothetical protein